jgi:FdhE protein
MRSDKWYVRISRSRDLALKYPSAAEGLRFYGHIAQFQKSLYGDLENECGREPVARLPGTLRQELDLFILLPRFAGFLSVVEKNAPAPLAQTAAALRATGATRWQEVLTKYWQADAQSDADIDPSQTLLAWTFFQPYAEYLADYTAHAPLHTTPATCPLCSSHPIVGALRPEGDGGKRWLTCSLCAHEWGYRRLVCPSCGSEDVHKLPVYTANEIASVRVEACDICRHYIKTVDMTKDGNAVPVVDEIATIALNLWAEEHGYTKIQANLLGI